MNGEADDRLEKVKRGAGRVPYVANAGTKSALRREYVWKRKGLKRGGKRRRVNCVAPHIAFGTKHKNTGKEGQRK